MTESQRVEIGFEGGQVIQARLREEILRDLRSRLASGGWHDLETEDGTIAMDLGRISFVRAEAAEHRVGFSSEG